MASAARKQPNCLHPAHPVTLLPSSLLSYTCYQQGPWEAACLLGVSAGRRWQWPWASLTPQTEEALTWDVHPAPAHDCPQPIRDSCCPSTAGAPAHPHPTALSEPAPRSSVRTLTQGKALLLEMQSRHLLPVPKASGLTTKQDRKTRAPRLCQWRRAVRAP